MPWPRDHNRMLASACRRLGVTGAVDVREWLAFATPSENAVTLSREPRTRKEAAKVLAHEATHLLLAQHINTRGNLDLKGLNEALRKALGKDRTEEVLSAMEEALCEAVGDALGPQLVRKK